MRRRLVGRQRDGNAYKGEHIDDGACQEEAHESALCHGCAHARNRCWERDPGLGLTAVYERSLGAGVGQADVGAPEAHVLRPVVPAVGVRSTEGYHLGAKMRYGENFYIEFCTLHPQAPSGHACRRLYAACRSKVSGPFEHDSMERRILYPDVEAYDADAHEMRDRRKLKMPPSPPTGDTSQQDTLGVGLGAAHLGAQHRGVAHEGEQVPRHVINHRVQLETRGGARTPAPAKPDVRLRVLWIRALRHYGARRYTADPEPGKYDTSALQPRQSPASAMRIL